jgi:hypothetical protein
MNKRFGIQYISSNEGRVLFNQNISSGQNYGRMAASGGSLNRKYNFCRNSGILDVNECVMNPNCCKNVNQEVIPVPVPTNVTEVLFGSYLDENSDFQAFYTELSTNGTWRPAITVPVGNDASSNPQTTILGVSLSSQKTGLAVGFYNNNYDQQEALVLSKGKGKEGTWEVTSTTIETIPGFVPYSEGGYSALLAVSSSTDGNAIACGYYDASGIAKSAFIINQEGGTWTQPVTFSDISQNYSFLQCVSDKGNGCAGGAYNYNNNYQAFVVDKINGSWIPTVHFVQLPTDFIPTANSSVTSISSSSVPSYAVAGGFYQDSSGVQPFLVERNSQSQNWGQAFRPDIVSIPPANNGLSKITCVSTSPDGMNTVAGGYQQYTYNTGSGNITYYYSFIVAKEGTGSWSSPQTIILPPDTSDSLVPYPNNSSTMITSVDATNGIAYGFYTDVNNNYQPMVVKRINNSWDPSAIPVTGITESSIFPTPSFHIPSTSTSNLYYNKNTLNNQGNINTNNTIQIANKSFQISTVDLPMGALIAGQNAFTTAAASYK